VADLWRRTLKDANRVLIHWADLYRELLASVGALASDTTVADSDVRERLRSLVAEHQQRKPPTRAQLVRDHLTLEIRPVRSLLSALMVLPWEATPGHPVLAAIQLLRALYAHDARELPTTARKLIARAGELAKLPFPIHPHMLRHSAGYKLANEGHDTRSIQQYLGHRNITHTVRYTELSPERFKNFWKD
jgi:Phage integrase family